MRVGSRQSDGQLDAQLSRWLWLVKRLLANPPRDLGFLWLAFVVHSIVAFFAILITGATHEPSFDFNLGKLRWSCGGSAPHLS